MIGVRKWVSGHKFVCSVGAFCSTIEEGERADLAFPGGWLTRSAWKGRFKVAQVVSDWMFARFCGPCRCDHQGGIRGTGMVEWLPMPLGVSCDSG